MNLLKKFKLEIREFSLWFKIAIIILGIIYLSLWFFTIYLSNIQKERNINPILPSAPKDSVEYVILSESLINDHSLSFNGRIETLRTPGYPLFVSTTKTVTGSYFGVTFVQIILVFMTAVIIRKIGLLFSSRQVGEIAAILLLINPVTMVLSLLILTDTLFMFLFTLGFYLAISINQEKTLSKVLVVSIIFVSAIYVRGMGIFALPIFLSPFFATKFIFKNQIKFIVLTLIFISIFITPWIIRNYVQVGVAGFNSFESVNMSWVIPKFLAEIKGTNEEDETQAFHRATGVPDKAWQDLGWHDIRYSKQISDVGESIILKQPLSYLKFHVITSIPFLFPSSILFARDAYDSATGVIRPFKYGAINYLTSGDWELFYQAIKSDWWKLGERLSWLVLLLISAYSFWIGRQNRLVWVFVFITGYLMFLSGPAAGPRLSFQAWPFIFLLFVSGLDNLYKKFSRHHTQIS
jgi:4-amino-4-deoxy-L-arabinose transferase-like glycosyltransferase